MGRTVVRSAGSGNLRLLPSFTESIVFFIPFVIIPPLPSLPQFPTTHLAMSLMSVGMIETNSRSSADWPDVWNRISHVPGKIPSQGDSLSLR